MTKHYNVHLYREMRLTFEGIEAVSPQQAAEQARDLAYDQATSIDDCEGENFAALVDVAGDEHYEKSEMVDFAAEKLRKAATLMYQALLEFIAKDDLAEKCSEWKWETLEPAFNVARAAVALAQTSCAECAAATIDIHELLSRRHQIAVLWSIEDVQEVRPDLTAEQSWQVLQATRHQHDATAGINWQMLELIAEDLFGDAPDTNEDEDALHDIT